MYGGVSPTQIWSREMYKPKTEALAYRIWCVANPLGWDLTVTDLSNMLGENTQRVARICQLKGWLNRLRPNPVKKWYTVPPLEHQRGHQTASFRDATPRTLNVEKLHQMGIDIDV